MKANRPDSPEYLARKARFAQMLTIYGRNPVAEALEDPALAPSRLHLADSNAPSRALDEMLQTARRRGVEVVYHERKALSRISRNAKQDQGVALDILCPGFASADALSALAADTSHCHGVIAVDGVTNPLNLGMIIRSCAAGHVAGLLLPEQGTAELGPLVIKASAGTVFKGSLYRCRALPEVLRQLRKEGASICTLSSHAPTSLYDHRPRPGLNVYVLGNESSGVSAEVEQLANDRLAIPMRNGVESLNVAVTAGILAFMPQLQHSRR